MADLFNHHWCSTCPLVFGCWQLSHVIFSQSEKERTACKAEQIHKMTTIFTQNDNLGSFRVKMIVILSDLQAVLFSSA
jgi:hypothetical protein